MSTMAHRPKLAGGTDLTPRYVCIKCGEEEGYRLEMTVKLKRFSSGQVKATLCLQDTWKHELKIEPGCANIPLRMPRYVNLEEDCLEVNISPLNDYDSVEKANVVSGTVPLKECIRCGQQKNNGKPFTKDILLPPEKTGFGKPRLEYVFEARTLYPFKGREKDIPVNTFIVSKTQSSEVNGITEVNYLCDNDKLVQGKTLDDKNEEVRGELNNSDSDWF